jgi:hypothetical protein
MIARRRLHEHIVEAVQASLGRILTGHPHLREVAAEWVEELARRVEVEARVDRRRGGRLDTRSLRLDCYLRANSGERALLCSVRARDLLTDYGKPVDARADARTLLLQLGLGIPDSPAALLGD